MSINKITRKNYPEHFDSFIDDFYKTSYEEHRKGSSFFKRSIVWLDEERCPDFPELWGYWETNTYVWGDNFGCELRDIDTLTRVEQKTRTIEEKYWAPVQEPPSPV